jgi:predicted O-methyltransferase YrrM
MELDARLDHERLYPVEWANRRVRDKFGDTVVAGPFAGLTYPDWGMTRVDLFSPKLLGCFELELHGEIDATIARGPRVVVNVGAAEGYYAVGMAMRLAEARVIAFETQQRHHASLNEIAALNRVDVRIDLRGECDPDALGDALEPGALVISDCDGYERDLLDPERVPALRASTLIVETHDLLVPGVTATLRERFAPSHELREIHARQRFVQDFPQLSSEEIPLVTRQLAISEFREGPQSWLVMDPR